MIKKFDPKLFIYDEETHTGTYEGKPVPSVTQLLDILYPYSEDIPEERLKKAAERGTTTHKLIEDMNSNFDNSLSYETNLDEAIQIAIHLDNQELIDYVSFLSTYKLKPFDYEELVFLFDEEGELICYGHYDATLMGTKDIAYFREGLLYLCDYKTTSLLDKRKVKLQENIYAIAYEQCSRNIIEDVFCLWFDDTTKLVPLGRYNKSYVISMAKLLKEQWEERQGELE